VKLIAIIWNTLTIQKIPQTDLLKQQLRDWLQRETLRFRPIKFAKHENIYNCGDEDQMVYVMESGQIKLVTLSPEGKECLLAIYTSGDVFGELCLANLGPRMETATAMEETILRRIPRVQLFTLLTNESLLQGFMQYLIVRIADQQQIISNLVTVNSERRLGETLLRLARTLGKKDIRSILIKHRISHQELSEIVGTTRPRISEFMKRFRKLGLIESTAERYLIVKERKLTEYLQHLT
jgi:CRP/FNR family cyclic AMP-dependent transcriptional regulator